MRAIATSRLPVPLSLCARPTTVRPPPATIVRVQVYQGQKRVNGVLCDHWLADMSNATANTTMYDAFSSRPTCLGSRPPAPFFGGSPRPNSAASPGLHRAARHFVLIGVLSVLLYPCRGRLLDYYFTVPEWSVVNANGILNLGFEVGLFPPRFPGAMSPHHMPGGQCRSCSVSCSWRPRLPRVPIGGCNP